MGNLHQQRIEIINFFFLHELNASKNKWIILCGNDFNIIINIGLATLKWLVQSKSYLNRPNDQIGRDFFILKASTMNYAFILYSCYYSGFYFTHTIPVRDSK